MILIRQGEIVSNEKREHLDLMTWEIFHWECGDVLAQIAQEQLHMPHLWKRSLRGWMGPGAT